METNENENSVSVRMRLSRQEISNPQEKEQKGTEAHGTLISSINPFNYTYSAR